MRRMIAVAAAALSILLAGWACGGRAPLTSRLDHPEDLPRPPTAEAPGLTSDLIPPGYTLGAP